MKKNDSIKFLNDPKINNKFERTKLFLSLTNKFLNMKYNANITIVWFPNIDQFKFETKKK